MYYGMLLLACEFFQRYDFGDNGMYFQICGGPLQ